MVNFEELWHFYTTNVGSLTPIGAGVGGAVLAYIAFGQFRTAREQSATAARQADIASQRHAEQTNADRARRITETFSKAVEQLAHEKLSVRLGGIYTLEQLAKESESLYIPAMEVMLAFVRERTHGKGVSSYGTVEGGDFPKPDPDIAAIFSVIRRRTEGNWQYEQSQNWRVELRYCNLWSADLSGAQLGGADFQGSILHRANFSGADLAAANFLVTHLNGVDFQNSNLERANFVKAGLTPFAPTFGGAKLKDVRFGISSVAGVDFSKTNGLTERTFARVAWQQ